MTPADLRAWQVQMGYKTQQDAAAALGVSWATYKRWLTAPELPRLTALACAALAAGLPLWPFRPGKTAGHAVQKATIAQS